MEFPEDVLANILVRLSIKDILRFKFVCKSWFRLITSSDPFFTSDYVRNTPFTLIYREQGVPLSLSLLEFTGNGGEYTLIPIITPKLPDHAFDFHTTFIGSCDCSVFILHRKRIIANDQVMDRVYMFNPVLGSCVKVTDNIIGKQKERQYKVGFIPSNNTYKLVRFDPGWKKAEKAEIFTVGLDENWRKVDDPLLFCGAYDYCAERLICFNGAFHWLSAEYVGDRFSREYDDMIFTFDLLEEKSGTAIPKPPGVSRLSRKTTKVTILNDCLSLSDLSVEYATMVIWTMREYGVVESWSKLIVLTLCDDRYPENWRYYNYLVPIVVLANGNILFSDKSSESMWFYNFEENRLIEIEHPNSSPPLRGRYEKAYVPRFYSFKGAAQASGACGLIRCKAKN